MSATPAVSLHAWSTGRQGADDRDSRTRQQRACDAFVERHNLQLVQTQTIAGQSAYRGSGSFRGRGIDDLIKQRRAGELPHGTVLVVEELSRLSRKNPVDVVGGLIRDLWDSGIALGITQLDLLIDGERARREPHHLHAIIVAAQLAHNESLIKSERSKSAWKGTKDAANSGKVRRKNVCPYWLKWDDASNGWVETPHANTIRRIFDLSAEGMGVAKIATVLNADGVQSYGGKRGKFSYRLVHKILKDKTVVGAWTTRDGDVIAGDYYLPIISQHQFDAVQDGLKARLVDRSNRQCRVGNILQGLTLCGHCGSKMSFVGRERNGKRQDYLHCNGKREGICDIGMWNYDENWLLSVVLQGHWQEWFKASAHSDELADAKALVDRLQLELSSDQKRLQGMEQRYQEAFSADTLTATDRRLQAAAIEDLAGVVAEHEQRLAVATKSLDALRARVVELDHDAFIENVKDALQHSTEWEPEQRLKFNRWLHQQGVTVLIEQGAAGRGEIPSELFKNTEGIPDRMDWWLSVQWRDELSELVPGSWVLQNRVS